MPRLIASLRLWRQPYLLSFLDLVTESFTLIAGTFSVPRSSISSRRCTPVVVSSVTPCILSSMAGYLSCSKEVRSPPSSNIMLASHGLPSLRIVCSRHHSYSSSVSPFQANTGIPPAAIAAAAWSCVEKMLHEDQRTSAPNSISVSINTPVWIVIWMQPRTFAPARGLLAEYLARIAISAGISLSAISSSRRPHWASEMSATL